MPRSQRNDNFIDKTFTILADILTQILPTTKREREAFIYYRDGEYAEALRSYYKAMRLEIDSYDRSYILHNIGLIHTSNGKHAKALEYYFQALERNSFSPQAFNNMAVICHYNWENIKENSDTRRSIKSQRKDFYNLLFRTPYLERIVREQAIQKGDLEISEAWFDQATEYWKRAITLSLDNYVEAQNWPKITGRLFPFSQSNR
ncbi:hypothetical protein KP509_29G032800 [Ceratopteris richardii]|uniref:Photosystem I assembly protein Ycf3 n=1 Tax=Ceratopteris richardii TaxID=49495 RepID=A0A8T2R729_CERRI|nr:hypothetical protein KP509_29G032800 [Ceratopteris richardii]